MKEKYLDQFHKETEIHKPTDTDLDWYQSQYITWLESKLHKAIELLDDLYELDNGPSLETYREAHEELIPKVIEFLNENTRS